MIEPKKEGVEPSPASTGKKQLDNLEPFKPEGGLKNDKGNKESMDKLKEEKDNYKRGMLKYKEEALRLKEEAKEKELSLSPTYSPIEPEYGTEEYEEYQFKAKYQKLREEEKKQEREKNIKISLDKFFVKYPQYSAENDIDGSKYQELQKMTSRMFLGNSVDEIMDSLELAHRTTLSTNPIPKPKEGKENKVGDSGIGDTNSILKGEEKKPDALTRSLNKWEQEAANVFPGGEEAYRKKLADKEQK
jgi:hypothetical protein